MLARSRNCPCLCKDLRLPNTLSKIMNFSHLLRHFRINSFGLGGKNALTILDDAYN